MLTKNLIGPSIRSILMLVFGTALGNGLITESEVQVIAAGIGALINFLVMVYARTKAP